MVSALVDLHGAVSWVVSFIAHQSGAGEHPAILQALEKLEGVSGAIGRLQNPQIDADERRLSGGVRG